MTDLDLELPGLALELLAEFGASITYISVTPGAYNPATGTATPTTINTSIKAVPEDYSANALAFSQGLIQAGDKRFTIGNSVTPKPGDKITFGADTYTVISVRAFNSGDLVAVYQVQARK